MRVSVAILLVAASCASAFVVPSALPQQQRASNGRTRGVVSARLGIYWTTDCSWVRWWHGSDRPARIECVTPLSMRP